MIDESFYDFYGKMVEFHFKNFISFLEKGRKTFNKIKRILQKKEKIEIFKYI